ncbi:MAG: NusG domain II-containing protein [Cellulosilyticaceae bacterium]
MKKGNLIMIACVTLLLIGSMVSLFFLSKGQSLTHPTAIISQNGKAIKTIDLTTSDSLSFTIEDGKGGFNTLQVQDGNIGIIEANCPDKLCIDSGFISNSILPLVCLPHGLTIEIQEATTDHSVDIIAQ